MPYADSTPAVAALHGDLLDRVGHALDGDADEPGGHALAARVRARCRADLLRERLERRARRVGVERLVGVRAEHARKEVGLDECARRLGPDLEPVLAERQDRAAAGRDGLDLEHRRADAHGGDDGIGRALELAGIERDVRRRAAHVEADDLRTADGTRGADHADDAAGRPRQ
jgi:hypothetical protein